jgi:hypothetical protein
MVKFTKGQIRKLKTAPPWKIIPTAQRERIQMALLRERGMTRSAIRQSAQQRTRGPSQYHSASPPTLWLLSRAEPWGNFVGWNWEKMFKNYALKFVDEVYVKLEDAALYIERNPARVKSITSFPTSQSHSDIETVSVTTVAALPA